MKKYFVGIFALGILFTLPAFSCKTETSDSTEEKGKDGDKTEINTIQLGTVMPADKIRMKGVDGAFYTLQDIAKENGTLVIFTACDCPFVIGNGNKSEGWEGRYNDVYKAAMDANVGMVLVNSNEAKRKGADSFENIMARHDEQGYQMNVLYDSHHKVADEFGAKFTPHVFLFDSEGKLVYTGAIDDNVQSSEKVKKEYLKDALNAIKEGKEIPVKESRALGCSIKRV